jgi:hypothetical protein
MRKIVDSFDFTPAFVNDLNSVEIPNTTFTKANIVVVEMTDRDMIGVDSDSVIRHWEDSSAIEYALYITLIGENGERNGIGEIGVWKTKGGFFETHSPVGIYYIEFKNKGWGIELYYQIIHWSLKYGLKVKSSKISRMRLAAKRCWESKRLRSKIKITKRNDRYHVKEIRNA